jgi:hypothetical protein
MTDFYERPSVMMPRARAAAEPAIKLDAGLSEAHASLGAVRFLYDWDWAGAEEELRRATDPRPGLRRGALVVRCVSRADGALRWASSDGARFAWRLNVPSRMQMSVESGRRAR